MKIAFGFFVAIIGIFLMNLTVDSFGSLGNDIMHGSGLVLLMGSMYFIYKGREKREKQQEVQK
ncbi:hypothetical protein [Jeotgalibacillus malaysiensis]|uniref:hypothetical protein n=1 Tax=Jeotgalibacillus malaysiensis TaxID=1508404 RepID=UPI00384F687C